MNRAGRVVIRMDVEKRWREWRRTSNELMCAGKEKKGIGLEPMRVAVEKSGGDAPEMDM